MTRAALRAARKEAVVVCGPTASGKSDFSDALAGRLSEVHGAWVPTLVVDSMQVYRELPIVTNQARSRRAELVGIVPVTEEWTVARHRASAEEIIDGLDTPFVLDAGTGMYLNAILLDIPLFPKVPLALRRAAQEVSAGAENPRRAARAKELELAGVAQRGSVWEGEPKYDATVIYLRPSRASVDAAVARRSERIARLGLQEVGRVQEKVEAGERVSASVLDSVGVRELTEHLRAEITLGEAARLIEIRTRRLARRQMRWFDKLVRTLEGRARVHVVEKPTEETLLHYMHDTIRS